MNISQMFNNTMVYLSEGFARIFGPTDDHYPRIGVQPFEGDPYKPSHWSE